MEKRLIHRRTFLRGAGSVAVALPFLESFASRKAFAAPAKRFATYFQCNGVNMDQWWPKTYGALTADTMKGSAIEPLSKFASKLLVPRGIAMSPRGFGQDGGQGCDHQRGMAQKLTCSFIEGGRPNGPSLDYVLAKGINPKGQDPIVLGTGEAGSGSGPLTSAFYKPSGQRADFQKDPATVYSAMMGMATMGGGMTVNLALKRRMSVLDIVKGDLTSMQADTYLSSQDKTKLKMHFDSVRQLETSLAGGGGGMLAPGAPAACGVGPARPGMGSDFEKNAIQMTNLMALLMACNVNNVVSLQMDRGSGGPMYSWLADGLNKKYRHHPLSHGATFDAAASPTLPAAEYKQALFNVDEWHMKMLANLVEKLASYSEPGGSVLDNSVVMYINELSNGLQHHFADLPVLIAGSGGGRLKNGEFIKVTAGSTGSGNECPTNQLFVSIARALDYVDPVTKAPMENFGTFVSPKKGPLSSIMKV